ncbi:MAG: ABC transporter permease, partial [Beijerinckiaceae bacterium]
MSRSLRLVVMRMVMAIPTLVLVACGGFLLLSFAPGDAVDAYFAETGSTTGAQELRQRWGLHGNTWQRFFAFMAGALQFDFGRSVIFSRPVTDVIIERLPNTLALMAGATALAAILGLWLGLLSGAKPGSLRDRIIGVATMVLNAVPNFWLGIVLIVVFAVQLGWFPVGGVRSMGGNGAPFADGIRHFVLPTLALGLGYLALYVRTLRAGMLATWPQDHVRAAQARGLPRTRVVWRAVARPALLPVVVLAGQQAGALFGGSVVVETVFAIPGFGRLAYEAVTGRDT